MEKRQVAMKVIFPWSLKLYSGRGSVHGKIEENYLFHFMAL